MNRIFLNSIAPLAALLGMVAFADAKIVIPFNETIDTNGIEKVVIKLSAGSISVQGTDSPELMLEVDQIFKTDSRSEAEEELENVEREIERQGDTLRIIFKRDRESSGFWKSILGNSGVYFDTKVVLPRHLEVSLETNGGHIEVFDVANGVKARTSGGNLKFEQIEGDVSADTSGGNIKAERIAGNANMNTSGGNIHISEIEGDADMRTSGGGVKVSNISGRIDARTSGGNMSCEFENGIAFDASFRTSGGSISAKVSRDASYRLDAHTSGGGVHLSIDSKIKGSVKKNRADIDVNGGGPKLILGTSGGNISVDSI